MINDKSVNIKKKLNNLLIVTIIMIILNLIFRKYQSNFWIFNTFTFDIVLILNIMFLIICYMFNKTIIDNKFVNISYAIVDTYAFISKTLLIFTFILLNVLNPSIVVGSSMNPTLQDQDRLILWKFLYEPKKDDIVVIDIDETYGKDDALYIKRVVATNLDTVMFENNGLYINNEFLLNISEEMFFTLTKTYNNEITNNDYTFTIPKGYSVVIGDNYNNSLDSRYIGLIKNCDIIGKAIFRFYPITNIEILK